MPRPAGGRTLSDDKFEALEKTLGKKESSE